METRVSLVLPDRATRPGGEAQLWMMTEDPSNGYEAIAQEWIAVRSATGASIVRRWAKTLPSGRSVLDVGSGTGEPLTAILAEEGLSVWAIDASPTLVAAFRRRLPGLIIACEAAEDSSFFDRTFDAAMMIGLIFLLSADRQRDLLQRLLGSLGPDGSLLFSAPWQDATWKDALTGRTSRSLGAKAYERILGAEGFRVVARHVDEGENHYFEARRSGSPGA